MRQQENTTATGLGLIVATILEKAKQSPSNDPNAGPKNENDLREKKQAEKTGSNPDPEVEDPNFIPDDANNEAQPHTGKPINQVIDQEDPTEIPDEEDEDDEDELEEELPLEETDDLDSEDPLEFPEEDVEEAAFDEDEDLDEEENNLSNS